MDRKLTFETIGCDPELFFIDKKTNEVISAEGIIPGTKDEPYFISSNGHMIQLDNVLVEFGIPPCKSFDEFKEAVAYAMKYITNEYGESYSIGKMASAELDHRFLQTEQALMFGCDADWNAWTHQTNPPPEAKSSKLRSAGGHVHVGVKEIDPTLKETISMTRLLDLFLGVPSILLDPDDRRKELYGKAGAFRFKPYLLEYRTLSNFWIHDTKLMEFVYNNVLKAFDFYNNEDFEKALEHVGKDIVKSINENDKLLAEKLVSNFNLL